MGDEKDYFRLEGVGMTNCLGASTEEIRSNLFSANHTCFSKRDDLIPDAIAIVGETRSELPPIPDELASYSSRNSQLLLAAYRQIEELVSESKVAFGADRIGTVLGSSTSGIAMSEDAISELRSNGSLPQHYQYSQQEIGSVSEFISVYAGVTGPSYTVSTACSSSTKVFMSAKRLLANDLCDAVIVGGSDSLCKLTLNGFYSLGLISDSFCNPMSKNRDGIRIGEGAALFLLTKRSGGIQLKGVGESSDAFHISAPEPEGAGAKASMSAALKDASLQPNDIQYINLHGTGTGPNDSMESKAVASVFPTLPLCSSTKPLTGHLLGASGATELAFCWLTLAQEPPTIALPPHYWDGEYDEEIPRLPLCDENSSIPAAGNVYCLSNSFAFGGSNASVIIGRNYDE